MSRTLKDIGVVLVALLLVVSFVTMHPSANTPPRDVTTILRVNAGHGYDRNPIYFTIPSGTDHWQLWWSYTCFGASFYWDAESTGYPASHRYTVHINETGSGGSGVSSYSGTGKYAVNVTTGGSCQWTLNVTTNKKPT